MKHLALVMLCAGLAGCVPSSPHGLNVADVCDSSYVREKNPDKYYVGYQRYSSCARDVAKGNDLRQQTWDEASARHQFQTSPSYATPSYSVSAPPIAPQPNQIPFQQASAPRQQTWGDTPYAPMVAPVMRDQPISNVNPMIPPSAY